MRPVLRWQERRILWIENEEEVVTDGGRLKGKMGKTPQLWPGWQYHPLRQRESGVRRYCWEGETSSYIQPRSAQCRYGRNIYKLDKYGSRVRTKNIDLGTINRHRMLTDDKGLEITQDVQ